MKPHLRATHEPPKLSEAAVRMLSILRTHCQGRARAMLAADIEAQFEISDRQQQRLIHELRRCGHIIVGGCGEVKGYWLAETLAEKMEAYAGFVSRTRDMEETMRMMRLNNPEIAQLQLTAQ